jgi:hypothetical protein
MYIIIKKSLAKGSFFINLRNNYSSLEFSPFRQKERGCIINSKTKKCSPLPFEEKVGIQGRNNN